MFDVKAVSNVRIALLQGDRRASSIIQVETNAAGVLRGVILKQAWAPRLLSEERERLIRHRCYTRSIDTRDAVENEGRCENSAVEGGYKHVYRGAGVSPEFP